MSDRLRQLLDDLPPPDDEAVAAVAGRAAETLRPAGALRRLDGLAAWVAGWQRTTTPRADHPAVLVFAADHGVAWASDVSAYPTSVTAAMLAAFRAGKATINAYADAVGATVAAIDVGVGDPTGDLRVERAVSPERWDLAVDAGITAVEQLDADVLVVGEMGIGNTTPAATVAALLAGEPGTGPDTDRPNVDGSGPDEIVGWVGPGTGVSGEGLARKVAAVHAGVARCRRRGVGDPLDVLAEVGGAELVAIAAAVAAARHRRLPVVLDGYVATAAVLPLERHRPGALGHCVAGHCSAEPGHRRLLAALGKHALLDLDLRLGEGTGALAAVPLLRLACAGVTEVATFGEWFGEGGP